MVNEVTSDELLADWEASAPNEPEYMEDNGDEVGKHIGKTVDSVTGDHLPDNLVDLSHKEEIDFMESWQVGKLVPNKMAQQRTGKRPIRGKWVNVNKGDSANPIIWSRYVACEVNTHKDESLFASKPPLEALRLLLSWTASGPRTGGQKGKY